MDQYKVQGEPLELSHSQERVLCTAQQREEKLQLLFKTIPSDDLRYNWTLVDQIFWSFSRGARTSGLEERARLT